MLKPAFSTVACPHWTLSEVAANARSYGYEAVELRSFGDDSRRFACDPALTSAAKTRELFGSAGVEVLCLATSLRFDEVIGPPVLGPVLWDQEKAVREGRRAIDLASSLECPFVRVFGFRVPQFDTRARCVVRICDRLRLVLDHAEKSGVRVVIENAGSFATSADLMELISACDHPLLGACYSNAAAVLAGECPASGVRSLGDRLWVARVAEASPVEGGGGGEQPGAMMPCEIDSPKGALHAKEFVGALACCNGGKGGFAGPLVYEHNLAFTPGAMAPEQVLAGAARAMFAWAGGAGGACGRGRSADQHERAHAHAAHAGR